MYPVLLFLYFFFSIWFLHLNPPNFLRTSWCACSGTIAIIELDKHAVGSVKLLQFLLSIVVKGPCEGMFRELGRYYDASFCELRIFKIVKTVSAAKTKTAVTACGCDTLQWMAVRSITKFLIYCICVWWGCPPTSEWHLRVRFGMYGLWSAETGKSRIRTALCIAVDPCASVSFF